VRGFTFRLAALLRVRQGLASLEENRLAQLNSERLAYENQQATLRDRRDQYLSRQCEDLLSGSTAVELQLASAFTQALATAEGDLQYRASELAKQILLQGEHYRSAQRELRKLERLRDDAWTSWKREQLRQEQKLNDELFLERRSCAMRSGEKL
jgi:flagellar export protein FliJ